MCKNTQTLILDTLCLKTFVRSRSAMTPLRSRSVTPDMHEAKHKESAEETHGEKKGEGANGSDKKHRRNSLNASEIKVLPCVRVFVFAYV
jgi:hypothetical protein